MVASCINLGSRAQDGIEQKEVQVADWLDLDWRCSALRLSGCLARRPSEKNIADNFDLHWCEEAAPRQQHGPARREADAARGQ